MIYDYIIVGGGISGLYVVYNLIKLNIGLKIALIESSDRLGGRLQNLKIDNIILDTGGARFNKSHKLLLNLIHTLKLSKYIKPIPNNIKFINLNNHIYDKELVNKFNTIDNFIIDLNKIIKHNNINNETLINNTIISLAKKYYKYKNIDKYINSLYPYYSELNILNAYEALKLFTNEFNNKTQYFILSNGLEQITIKLYNLIKNKIDIHKNTNVIDIEYNDNKYKIISNNKYYYCKSVILSIPKLSLIKLNIFKPIKPLLNQISIQPLFRIFAKYSKHKETNKVWFYNLSKISTDLHIKYIIPINYDLGIIMISYTDGKYANYWLNKLNNNTIEKYLYLDLIKLFPELDIPKTPLWLKYYYWKTGAGYWKPKYINKDQLLKPFNKHNIYICGENYSNKQAWIEGSLETSTQVINLLLTKHNYKPNIQLNSFINKKYYNTQKYYTKTKHNIKHKYKIKTKKL